MRAKTFCICIISPSFYCSSIEALTKIVAFETLFIHIVKDSICLKSFQTKQRLGKRKKYYNADNLCFNTSLPWISVYRMDAQ